MGLTLELWQAHAGPCTLRLQQPPALTRTKLEAWRMEWCGGTRWSLMEMLELPLHAWHKQHQTASETATLNRYATGGTGPVPQSRTGVTVPHQHPHSCSTETSLPDRCAVITAIKYMLFTSDVPLLVSPAVLSFSQLS